MLGTENIIKCVNSTPSVVRFIHISTQYVVTPGSLPPTDDYLEPYTAYGQSKAEGERLVRRDCHKCWVILRPTNIWGPWHPFFPNELWKYLAKRYYIHPGYNPTQKYYGYIDNAIEQIKAITFYDESICSKVFYITDPPIDNAEWMN